MRDNHPAIVEITEDRPRAKAQWKTPQLVQATIAVSTTGCSNASNVEASTQKSGS